MYLKKMNDPKAGSKTKIVFNNGKEEFEDLRNLIERTFPGGNAQLEKESQQLIDKLESGYVETDERENSYPSTAIADSALSLVLPLFCYAMVQKTPEPEKVDRRKYIEVEKYNALMVEYDKATGYVQSLQEQFNDPQLATELTKYKTEAERLKEVNSRLKNDLKSVEDSRLKAIEGFIYDFQDDNDSKEQLQNVFVEKRKEYIASSNTQEKNAIINDMNNEVGRLISLLVTVRNTNEKNIDDRNRELEKIKAENAELNKKMDSILIQHTKFKNSIQAMQPAIESIKNGANFLETNFSVKESTEQ